MFFRLLSLVLVLMSSSACQLVIDQSDILTNKETGEGELDPSNSGLEPDSETSGTDADTDSSAQSETNADEKDGSNDGEDSRDIVNEADIDEDGILNEADNCPALENPGQIDTDKDGLGDECDDDVKGYSGKYLQKSTIFGILSQTYPSAECAQLNIITGVTSFEEIELAIKDDYTITFNSSMLNDIPARYNAVSGGFKLNNDFSYTHDGISYTGNVRRIAEFDRDAQEIVGTDTFTFQANNTSTNEKIANCAAIASIKYVKISNIDDIDNDLVLNNNDNCIYTVNPEQLDTDKDNIGDQCDLDPFNYSGQYNNYSINTQLEDKPGYCEDMAEFVVGYRDFEISNVEFKHDLFILTSKKYGNLVAPYDVATKKISIDQTFNLVHDGLNWFGGATGSGTFDEITQTLSSENTYSIGTSTLDGKLFDSCRVKTTATIAKITIPEDKDNDGIPDIDDYCPLLASTNNDDTDGDGIGDACDNDIINITGTYLVKTTLLPEKNTYSGTVCEPLTVKTQDLTHMRLNLIDDKFSGKIANQQLSDWALDISTLDVRGGTQDLFIENTKFDIESQSLSGTLVSTVLVDDIDSTRCTLTSSFTTQKTHAWDFDNDGVSNATDNCVLIANKDQLDTNENGVGDVCDGTGF